MSFGQRVPPICCGAGDEYHDHTHAPLFPISKLFYVPFRACWGLKIQSVHNEFAVLCQPYKIKHLVGTENEYCALDAICDFVRVGK